MGQAASKAAEAAARAAQRAAPRASQAAQQARRTRSAAEAEWSRTARPSDEYNPTRGHRHHADNDAAIARAASSRGDGDVPETMPELPPDLIKFLNDAGPLQRTVDKDRTSARVYDTLVKDEKARDELEKQANKRVRRKMPIMSSYEDSGKVEGDGTMTERTTNFSTTDRSEKSTTFGVTREDLFRLSSNLGSLSVDGPEWKKAFDSEYDAIAKGGGKSKNFDQMKDRALLENSLRYVGVPSLLKDQEGDIIGVWPRKARDLRHSFGLKAVPERSVEFVMLNEGEDSARS